MAQTYCTRLEIESIIGPAGVLANIDDDADGVESPDDQLHVAAAIERAAIEMNIALENQYPTLSSLSANDWCKWCNAYIAAFHLFARKGNAPTASIVDQVQTYRDQLSEARWGRFQIPQATPQSDARPAVSSMKPDLRNPSSPIAVDTDQSTGGTPTSGVKRNTYGYPWGPF